MVYPDSKHDSPLDMGHCYEDLIGLLLKRYYDFKVSFYRSKFEQYNIGESAEGLEVKLDLWCTRTRRLSIEVAEKTSEGQSSFSPSGIMRNDNTKIYSQGNLERCWFFEKLALRGVYRNLKPWLIDNNPPTIRKFYLSLREAESLAIFTLRVSPFVCDYGHILDCKWDNCLPCAKYQGGECLSDGAKLYHRIKQCFNEGDK
ncbi:hypothetical protein ACFLXT_02635 [Chloroflexota bacterium]